MIITKFLCSSEKQWQESSDTPLTFEYISNMKVLGPSKTFFLGHPVDKSWNKNSEKGMYFYITWSEMVRSPRHLIVPNTRPLSTRHILPLDHFIFAFGCKQLFSVSDQPKVRLSQAAHMPHLALTAVLLLSVSSAPSDFFILTWKIYILSVSPICNIVNITRSKIY